MMTDADALLAARCTLERCLEYVGAEADRYGTASTAGPLLELILRTLGRLETADQYVLRLRKAAADLHEKYMMEELRRRKADERR